MTKMSPSFALMICIGISVMLQTGGHWGTDLVQTFVHVEVGKAMCFGVGDVDEGRDETTIFVLRNVGGAVRACVIVRFRIQGSRRKVELVDRICAVEDRSLRDRWLVPGGGLADAERNMRVHSSLGGW